MVHSDGFHFHGNCLRQEYTMLIMDSKNNDSKFVHGYVKSYGS